MNMGAGVWEGKVWEGSKCFPAGWKSPSSSGRDPTLMLTGHARWGLRMVHPDPNAMQVPVNTSHQKHYCVEHKGRN